MIPHPTSDEGSTTPSSKYPETKKQEIVFRRPPAFLCVTNDLLGTDISIFIRCYVKPFLKRSDKPTAIVIADSFTDCINTVIR